MFLLFALACQPDPLLSRALPEVSDDQDWLVDPGGDTGEARDTDTGRRDEGGDEGGDAGGRSGGAAGGDSGQRRPRSQLLSV